jgi:hypothetical protein
MYRAEEMLALKGPIRLEGEGKSQKIVNECGQELRDATLIDFTGPGEANEQYVGTIAAGASVEISKLKDQPRSVPAELASRPDPTSVLGELRSYFEDRPENRGELRLVALVPAVVPGQVIEPPVDRQRGFTAVVVHLRCGSPPPPENYRYNLLAKRGARDGPELMSPEEIQQWYRPPISRPLPSRRRISPGPAVKSGNRGMRPLNSQ